MSNIDKQAVQAVADLKAGYTLGHADVAILNELARIALASLEAEPVAYIRDGFRADGVHFCGGIITAEEHERTKPALSDRYNWKHQPLYAAPPAPVVPAELHHDTRKLVTDFCTALAKKLYKAQLKYGYDADWKQDGWPTQCQTHFHQHIAKGDPRDVAAYCAFMWYHGWKTEPAEVSVPDERYQNLSELYHAQEKRLFKIAQRIKGPSFDKYACSPSQAIDALESAIFGEREDDCRAAMLQGAGPQIKAYTLRDGWVAVPVEMTPEQMRAVQRDSSLGTFASAHLSGAYDMYREFWNVAIAAAPQQEV